MKLNNITKDTRFHLDYETYSPEDLKNYGAYKYAEHKEAKILIFAIAIDVENVEDAEVFTWDILNGGDQALSMFRKAVELGCIIYAHNAQFEAAISKYVLERQLNIPEPKLESWRCTAAMARRAAIPSNLAACGEFLGFDVEHAKDNKGKALIRKFSIPQKTNKHAPKSTWYDIQPEDEPEEFNAFVEYCRQDVIAEIAIHKRLKAFELKGAVLESFQFDFRMNDRGVPVDIESLKSTSKNIEIYEQIHKNLFIEKTGYKPASPKVKLWMKERGYPFDNMQKDNVEIVLENGPSGWVVRGHGPVNMTEEAFEALKIRALVSYAAVKKVPTMLGAACSDGRVRGSLLWSGAERTHRWAGRIIQPQNFRRPTFKKTKEAYDLIKAGYSIDEIEARLELITGKRYGYFEIVASCVRHFIQEGDKELLQADYSSVEGRGAPWLCDGITKLNKFYNNIPVYEDMASKIFGVSVEEVVAKNEAGDSEMRFLGKQAELGCTYNMGAPKFRATCEKWKYIPSESMVNKFKEVYMKRLSRNLTAFSKNEDIDSQHNFTIVQEDEDSKPKLGIKVYHKGGEKRIMTNLFMPSEQQWIDLTYDELARKAVKAWREDNPETVQAWRDIDSVAKHALRNPGKLFEATSKISFAVTKAPGFQALILKLPSGHNLIYPKAKISWKPFKDEDGNIDKNLKPNINDNFNTEIKFWGKVKGGWGWCSTYGGKLLENATQAICGDLMGSGSVIAEKAGVKALMLVHDEMIAVKDSEIDHEDLCKFLCDKPEWAEGFPLDAEGDTIPFYKK